ncbi:MAG: hypothetical protein DCF32_15015 [Leptolyngbya sp.]|nr:MAG: hypothetical protein DCF32_15015 [Leptolyngbya sp.]
MVTLVKAAIAPPEVNEETVAIAPSAGEAQVMLELHQRIQDSGIELLQRAKELGDRLAAKKAELGHGNWGPWLAEYLPQISDRHVRNYLNIAARWPELEAWIETQQASGELSLRGALNYLSEASREETGLPSNEQIVATWEQVAKIVKNGRAAMVVELIHQMVAKEFEYPKNVRTYEALWELWQAEGDRILERHNLWSASERFNVGDYVRGVDKDGQTQQGFIQKCGLKYLNLDIGHVLTESASKIDPPAIFHVPDRGDSPSEASVSPDSDLAMESPLKAVEEGEDGAEFRYREVFGVATRRQLEIFNNTYSGDTLTGDKIRGMFEFGGKQWVCTSGMGGGALGATGIVPAAEWDGPTYSYNTQPPGIKFTYAGILVKYPGVEYVLTDERLRLTEQVEEQVDPGKTPSQEEVFATWGAIAKVTKRRGKFPFIVEAYRDEMLHFRFPKGFANLDALWADWVNNSPRYLEYLTKLDNDAVTDGSVFDGSRQELAIGDRVVVVDFWEDGGAIVELDPELKMAEVKWDDLESDREPWINTSDLFKPQNGNGVTDTQPISRQAQMSQKLRKANATTEEAPGIDQDENNTPAWVWQPILDRWGRGEFDIDVATNEHSNVPAIAGFTKDNSALDAEVTWQVEPTDDEAETTGWENPPFSKNGIFSKKFAEQHDKGQLPTHFFVLNKADSRTAWHKEYMVRCQAVCRVDRYVKFEQPEGDRQGATFSIDVFYFGPDKERFAEATAHYGTVCFPANIKGLYELPPSEQVIEIEASEV